MINKISIVFFSPNGQPQGPRARIYNYALRLVNKGHHVTIFTKSHFHGTNENRIKDKSSYLVEKIQGIETIWISTLSYNSNGFKRLLSEFQFVIKSLMYVFVKKMNFDVLIADSVTPINGIGGLIAAKLAGSKFIHQIRDVWPIALVHDGSISARSIPYFFFRLLEKIIYKKADWVCSALPYVHDHISHSGGNSNKISYIRNGADLTPYQNTKQYTGGGYHIIATYVGTISFAHDVITIINTANIFQKNNDKRVSFHIYGEGVKKEECVNAAKRFGLKNVFFFGMIDKRDVPNVLSNSDLLLAPVLKSDAYSFGINLNKLYDYMASGRPILFSGMTPNDDVMEAEAGYSIEPENADLMYLKILNYLSLDPSQRAKMGENAYKYAIENYDVDILVGQFEEMLFNVLEHGT